MSDRVTECAIALARAQGACAGLQTALDLANAAGLTGSTAPGGLTLAGIQAALDGAKVNLVRAEDAWLIAIGEADFAPDGTPRKRAANTVHNITAYEVHRG